MKKQMKASEALDVLVDPENLMQNLVVVPEGARVRDIVEDDRGQDRHQQAARSPRPWPTRRPSGCPPEAEGNPEGYLYPATYTVPPKQDALGLITQMVAKTVEAEQSLDIEAKAKALGLTPEEVLTVASILEYEANKSEDYPKVARVLYNRLKKDMPLQLDSTVSYVSKRSGDVWTTAAERSNTSAVQHLQARRAASRADRVAGQGDDRGGAEPRRRATGSTSSRTTRTTPPGSPRRTRSTRSGSRS